MAERRLSGRERHEQQRAAANKRLTDGIGESMAKQQKKDEEERRLREEKKEAERQIKVGKLKKAENIKKKDVHPAKAAGLKSVLVTPEGVYTTSFGKGSKAIVEKKIVNDAVEPINTDKPQFDVTVAEHQYQLKNVRFGDPAATDKPKTVHQDAIRRKAQLEQRYFGKTFDDNIHIQLIYNILDIRKLLTVHANNIIYVLDNLLRAETSASETVGDFETAGDTRNYEKDVFGNFSFITLLDKNDKKIERLLSAPQLAYFGSAFYNISGNVAKLKDKEDIFNTLCILGTFRQTCVHETCLVSKDSELSSESVLYGVDKWEDKYLKIIDEHYAKAVDGMNKSFRKNNEKANCYFLKKMYSEETVDDIMNEFYRFVVRKDYKNYGFSLRTLRESMFTLSDELLTRIQGTAFDTVRSKLYTLFDFAIVYYYNKIQLKKDEEYPIVVELRHAANDEEKKSAIYQREAASVWSKIRPRIDCIIDEMNGKKIKDIKEKCAFSIRNQIGADASEFSKLMYMLTLFLSGKEINDLLTTLINKFDNIQSFLDTLKDLNMECDFLPAYTLLSSSGKISEDLRVINAFCRMQKAMPDAKKIMYREAVEILGADITDEDLDDLLDNVLCVKEREGTVALKDVENADAILKAFGAIITANIKDEKKVIEQREKLVERFEKAQTVSCTDTTVTKRMTVKVSRKSGFRNFLASNVIESNRFQYLIRYNNAKKVRALASNLSLIKFQLGRLPDTQIARYYKSCTGSSGYDKNTMISYLANLIHDLSFRDFEDVVQDDRRATYEEKKDKQKKQAVISLYLTVLYLLVKNLVYVNSRYAMAFAAVERDLALYDIPLSEKTKRDGKDWTEYHRMDLTKMFTEGETPLLNKRAADYLKEDMKQITESAVDAFRNTVAHLNVIQNADIYAPQMKEVTSYFGIYHYVLQRHMLKLNSKYIPRAEEWSRKIEASGVYCRDFVKALCVPFGYNLPRFKNLSICNLFDKQEMPEAKRSDDEEMKPE